MAATLMVKPSLRAELRLGLRFYLGLGAPAETRRYPECRVRAARDCPPEVVRSAISMWLRRDQTPPASGAGACLLPSAPPAGQEASSCPTGVSLHLINHRSAQVALPSWPAPLFLKEFPWHRRAHDLERALRLSRAHRAWRAAHVLPRLGIATPRALGLAQRRGEDGRVVEYLVTEWLEGVTPLAEALKAADPARRAALLREFAEHLRFWHRQALYTRDLVKNVLVSEAAGRRTYWLIDLDGVHPVRRVNRARVLFHLRQLAFYCPLSEEEARAVATAYAGEAAGEVVGALLASG